MASFSDVQATCQVESLCFDDAELLLLVTLGNVIERGVGAHKRHIDTQIWIASCSSACTEYFSSIASLRKMR